MGPTNKPIKQIYYTYINTIMKQYITSIIILFSTLFVQTSAFICPTTTRTAFTTAVVPLFMSDEATTTTTTTEKKKKEMVMDENFDNVDIVRLLGIRRVKKMIRRDKRIAAVAKAEEEKKNVVYKPKGRWRKRNKK